MNLICITCPRGCHLSVEKIGDEVKVTGNSCPRGIVYATNELIDPKRTLTTTVAIDGKRICRLPVISSSPLPKDRIMDVMKELKGLKVKTPVHLGDVLVRDVLGLGSDIVASKTVEE